MQFEGSLLQLHAIMMTPSHAKWSADQERWLRNHCKASTALMAPAPAPSTANAARADASPAPAIADASPAPKTRAQAKKAEAANKPPVTAAADAAGTDSDDLEPRDAGRASSAWKRTRAQHQGEGGQARAAPNSMPSSRRHPGPEERGN